MMPTIDLTTHELANTPTIGALNPTTTTVGGTGAVIAPLGAAFTEGSDASAATSTIYEIDGGDTFSGSLSGSDTEDWIQIDLESGEFLRLELESDNSSYDITLELFSSTGVRIQGEDFYDSDQAWSTFYNDTGSTNTYYIAASTFNGIAQDYTLTATTTGYQQGSYDQIAEGLTTSWIGTEMAYDVGPGGTIFYDHDGLTADGKFLAEAALEAWTMVTGINFTYSGSTTTSTGMVFDDNSSGAFAGPASIGENGVISGSSINVGTGWLASYGTTIDSYSFVTYIHEIGHALGLDHSGPYNGTATYSDVPAGDNVWSNDSYLATVMSYFGLNEITGEWTDSWDPLTPMIADIKAMQLLYGVAGDLRLGDTTYGENSNAGGYYDDLASLSGAIALTIIDDGGEDTLDYGSSTANNNVDMRPGEVSDVGGLTNNLMIFDTTFIENLILGSGDDVVEGNGIKNDVRAGSGNDTIDGNGGSDKIYGQAGEDELNGGTGGDKLYGGGNNDILNGEEGKDYLSGGGNSDTAYGGAEDDKAYGNGGQDFLYGGDGEDSVYGGGGNDTMSGGAQDDFLAGGRGRDTITAGDGDDTIIGGSDKDTFVFDDNDDTNIIEDFQNGVDRFSLTQSSFSDVSITYDGTDTTLMFGNTTVILEGVDESLIGANDFL
jgi:serralysin